MGALTASVVVPATSANLGCAFDCAAIALNLYLRAQANVTSAPGLLLSYRGVQADQIPSDESNLVVRALRRSVELLSRQTAGSSNFSAFSGLKIDLENDIPLGIGLGSSAAAIIAGMVLGAELCGKQLDSSELLRMALTIEGHPDNLAAAIHGGMVVAATLAAPAIELANNSAGVLVAKAEVSADLDFIAVVPDVPLPTEKARAALPANYSREDVVANLQRTALLTARFFSGQHLSPELFLDRLHQPYRQSLVPGIAQCLEYRHPGLLGIFLSGAGSAVMALVEKEAGNPERSQRIAQDLVAVFERQGTSARALQLKADNTGTRVLGPAASRSFPAPSL